MKPIITKKYVLEIIMLIQGNPGRQKHIAIFLTLNKYVDGVPENFTISNRLE